MPQAKEGSMLRRFASQGNCLLMIFSVTNEDQSVGIAELAGTSVEAMNEIALSFCILRARLLKRLSLFPTSELLQLLSLTRLTQLPFNRNVNLSSGIYTCHMEIVLFATSSSSDVVIL